MIQHSLILGVNPFIQSYIASDIFGKMIFIGLIFLSMLSWVILLYKGILVWRAKKNALDFQSVFLDQLKNFTSAPLAIDLTALPCEKTPNPFLDLYLVLKKQALTLLNKNKGEGLQIGLLSSIDLDVLADSLYIEGEAQAKTLEKYLYLLSTVVSLAPFLGLLGTVWGILITFSSMQSQVAGSSQVVLEGLSLALTTTVLGLVDAIPALVGYNYIKNSMSDFRVDMEGFNLAMVHAMELEYRARGATVESCERGDVHVSV
ncbi:MAG: MotA/TolQ/ExbB proton channel family protein [Parachlamydiaceae bacterium]|nr:MotA/TolQ/ExbB proton channel family protein [Parachlamydiaceae bacterium]